jgi:hypothetical protein
VSGYEIVQNATTHAIVNQQTGLIDLSVSCPADKSVIGGGATADVQPKFDNQGAFGAVQKSEPENNTTWAATAGWVNSTTTGQSITLSVKAVCAVVG